MLPTLGRTVLFRSRTGNYTLAAEVIGTQASLNPRGVELGHVPALDSPWHVHLLVRTPALTRPMRSEADDFVDGSDAAIEEPRNGLYREWNVGPAGLEHFDDLGTIWQANEQALQAIYTEGIDLLDMHAIIQPESWRQPEGRGSQFGARTWAWPEEVS